MSAVHAFIHTAITETPLALVAGVAMPVARIRKTVAFSAENAGF